MKSTRRRLGLISGLFCPFILQQRPAGTLFNHIFHHQEDDGGDDQDQDQNGDGDDDDGDDDDDQDQNDDDDDFHLRV